MKWLVWLLNMLVGCYSTFQSFRNPDKFQFTVLVVLACVMFSLSIIGLKAYERGAE